MISLGLDIKTIQARGGYSTASTPLEIYGHLFEKHDKEIAKDIYKSATKNKTPNLLPTYGTKTAPNR